MRKLDLQIDANNKDWLEEQYIKLQRGYSDIAIECGTTSDAIKTRLKRFGIPIRTQKEALAIRNAKHPNRASPIKRLELSEKQRTGHYITCKFCDSIIYVNKKSKKSYCSIECRNNYWKEHRKRDQDWRYYPEYKEWRNLVYIRDNWKCRICGSKVKLNAHHIKEGALFPLLRFDTSNGVTLCEKHHIQVHSPLSKELLMNNPNIGGNPEVDNPEASLREYLYSLIRSND